MIDDSNIGVADPTPYSIRPARLDEIAELETLISRSVRALGVNDYTEEQLEAALRTVFGVDTQLIADGTYLVVEHCKQIIACGGWSFRKTLFGSDSETARNPAQLDPTTDAARIRAFFVDPDFARQGVGPQLLSACEALARGRGYSRAELVATLSGQYLYKACGYVASDPVEHVLDTMLRIRFVPMCKTLIDTHG